MGKIYWSVVALIIVTGLSIAWYVANENENSVKFAPQQFENENQAIDAVLPLFQKMSERYQWIFLAPQPENDLHWKLVMLLIEKVNQDKQWTVVVDTYFSKATGYRGDLDLSLLQSQSSFLPLLLQKYPKKKILLISPNVLSTQIIAESVRSSVMFQKIAPENGALTFLTYTKSRDEEADYLLPCSESRDLKTGLSDLGCYVRQQARPFYKTLTNLKSPSGFLLELNSSELVLFIQ
jgi:hypothetical protein